MKKMLATLVLLGLAVGGFALDVSVGAGGALGLFTSYPDFKGTLSGNSVEVKESVTPIEFKAFFDATYIQASVGYMSINGGSITTTVNGSTVPSLSGNFTGSLSYVTFAVYGKYPIVLGPVTLFPLLGIEYRLNLTDVDGSGNDLKSGLTSQEQSDLNELWFEAGAGADITFGRLYIRPEMLIGFKPLSTTDNNSVSTFQAEGYTSTSLTYFTFKVNLLVGYKL